MIEVLHIIIVLVISPRFPPVSLIAIYVKVMNELLAQFIPELYHVALLVKLSCRCPSSRLYVDCGGPQANC